jgi:hypothetical protein
VRQSLQCGNTLGCYIFSGNRVLATAESVMNRERVQANRMMPTEVAVVPHATA